MFLVFITYVVAGTLVFRSWYASTIDMISIVNEEISGDIAVQVDAFMQVPVGTNQINRVLLENQLIDLRDEAARERLFVGLLQEQPPDIYSVSFGTESGEYYGARRNPDNEIEIMRNNESTGGHSWYYSVGDDGRADKLVLEAGAFDARTRDWYKAARFSGEAVFSPIYKHFVLDDLTISAAHPVYDSQGKLTGVLGIHTTLARASSLLTTIVEDKNAQALIVESGTAFLIGNTLGLEPFRELPDDTVERNTIDDVNLPTLSRFHDRYLSTGEDADRIRMNGNWYHVHATPYRQPGIDWLILTMIPENDYTAGIFSNMLFTAGLILVLLLFIAFLYLHFTNRLLKRLSRLIQTAEQFSAGDHSLRIAPERPDEFGRLAQTFNNMADSVSSLIDNLDDLVAERTAKIEYLSQHDALTGLLNRASFDQAFHRLASEFDGTVAIITADLNGLKLTNDVFGHSAGDQLLKTAADVIRRTCREEDVIARTGGDEFTILLPDTTLQQAEQIAQRIRQAFADDKSIAIRGSISLGCAARSDMEHNLRDVLERAETGMYQDKTLNRKHSQEEMLDTLVDSLHEHLPREKDHANRVSRLSHDLAVAMKLTADDVRKAADAGYLHDIGKVTLDPALFQPDHVLTPQEQLDLRQHCLVGYRILNAFESTAALAEIVLTHHESWDGCGYPKGLVKEEIPLLARILSITQYYDVLTNNYHQTALDPSDALSEIQSLSGIRFDPVVTDAFIRMMRETNS